jgi:hypothetical protein
MAVKLKKGLTIALLIIVSAVIGLIGRSVRIGHALQSDPLIRSQFAETVAANEPLTAALEKYHRDHTFYPTSLIALKDEYLRSPPTQARVGFRAGLLYSAALQDQIYKTPECAARQSEFEGWIMKSTPELEREKADFISQCVVGYRQITLQSADFHHDPQGALTKIEQWAYYTSQSGQWTIGWCSHEGERAKGRRQKVASNGVCRY